MKSNVKYQWSRINWLWCLQRCSVFSKAVKAKQIISHQSNCINIWGWYLPDLQKFSCQYLITVHALCWCHAPSEVLNASQEICFNQRLTCILFFPAALLNPEQSFHLSQHIQEAVSSVQTALGRFVICFHLKVQTILKILYEKLR